MFASLLLAASVGLKVVVPSFQTSDVPDFVGHRMSQLVAKRINALGCATALSIDDVPATMRENLDACHGQASCVASLAEVLSASHVLVGYVWSVGIHYSVRMLVVDVANRRLVKSYVDKVPANIGNLPAVVAREGQSICDSLYSHDDLALGALPAPIAKGFDNLPPAPAPPAAPGTVTTSAPAPVATRPQPPAASSPAVPAPPSTALGMSGGGAPAMSRSVTTREGPGIPKPLPPIVSSELPPISAPPSTVLRMSANASGHAPAGPESNPARPSSGPPTTTPTATASTALPAPGHSRVRLHLGETSTVLPTPGPSGVRRQLAGTSGAESWLHPPVSPRVRMWTWVGLGTTGAALILGGSFGLSTLSALSTRSSATSQTDFYAAQSSLGTRATVANVAYGVTAAALAASAVLWFEGDRLFPAGP